ncbi:AAA family ATPase [Tunturiibacter gelidiferens]|uniref:AAA family ATPase n=1 Tax=Tunturiibacter gelidiferens TaxID=3069689 RepID=UPI003D9B2D24
MFTKASLNCGRIILPRGIEDERARGNLHFISGRLASGKTTLTRRIADQEGVVFICEDIRLAKLSDGISSFEDYLKWSRRCRSVIGPLVVQILRAGTSVVLDFAGNTQAERKWVLSLFEEAEVKHVLHYLDVPEDECLARLKNRNETKPEGLYFATTSEEEFLAVPRWFQPPVAEEGSHVSPE